MQLSYQSTLLEVSDMIVTSTIMKSIKDKFNSNFSKRNLCLLKYMISIDIENLVLQFHNLTKNLVMSELYFAATHCFFIWLLSLACFAVLWNGIKKQVQISFSYYTGSCGGLRICHSYYDKPVQEKILLSCVKEQWGLGNLVTFKILFLSTAIMLLFLPQTGPYVLAVD